MLWKVRSFSMICHVKTEYCVVIYMAGRQIEYYPAMVSVEQA